MTTIPQAAASFGWRAQVQVGGLRLDLLAAVQGRAISVKKRLS
jgi:hypothetical protein